MHQLPPERAHRVAIEMLRYGIAPRFKGEDDPILRTKVLGRIFSNPVGLAAGFDKNAEVPDALLDLGFGFVEVGTITPLPQAGNLKPRLFRDPANKALVNRMGFNGKGLEAALARLEGRERRGIVGANVGRNMVTPDVVADYATCIGRLGRIVDYLVVNISSPSTKGIRDLHAAEALTKLLEVCLRARDASRGSCPLLLKIAPDLDDTALSELCDVVLRQAIDGLIISNSSFSRPTGLSPELMREAGGLSGPPMRAVATNRIHATFRYTGGKIPLIGVGGISNAEDAFEKIKAGASLVQLYTGLIYEGPGVVTDIKTGIARLLREQGFGSMEEAVGSGI